MMIWSILDSSLLPIARNSLKLRNCMQALGNTSDAGIDSEFCTLTNVQRQPITHFQSTNRCMVLELFYSHGSSTNHRLFQHLSLSLYTRFKVPEYLAILSLYWTTHRLKNKIELTYRCDHVRIANLGHQIMITPIDV
jgi:hypothetical protein